MKRHAVALRAFTHADEPFANGQVILDMDANQFGDWKLAELVREATDEEVAAARGDKLETKLPDPPVPGKGKSQPSNDLPAGQKPPADAG